MVEFTSKKIKLFTVLSCTVICLIFLSYGQKGNSEELADNIKGYSEDVVLEDFFLIFSSDPKSQKQALTKISNNWQPGYAPLLIELVGWSPRSSLAADIVNLLQSKTKQSFAYDMNKWFEWSWNQDLQTPSFYPELKSEIYRSIDPKFSKYFSNERKINIRLDEVRWGGVHQDGIPPLREPKMLKANEATYLEEDNIVFGISVNGDARAYPKRILAWHEMFIDTVGGVPVTGAYCTLCGSMILYESTLGKTLHRLGTSGFLYRSNKLMYDAETQSLWNTLLGEPVIGPLVGKGISLNRLSVVTTTWGEWLKRHPDTTVLSLDTGHKRDYSEGEAYRAYFSTDELMFNVPKLDRRLKNKAEVLGLVFKDVPNEALAVSAEFLQKNLLYNAKLGKQSFVIITDNTGANRIYDSSSVVFKSWDTKNQVLDSEGKYWKLSEKALVSEGGQKLYRLPAHRAFWFGWFSAYPHTKLIH